MTSPPSRRPAPSSSARSVRCRMPTRASRMARVELLRRCRSRCRGRPSSGPRRRSRPSTGSCPSIWRNWRRSPRSSFFASSASLRAFASASAFAFASATRFASASPWPSPRLRPSPSPRRRFLASCLGLRFGRLLALAFASASAFAAATFCCAWPRLPPSRCSFGPPRGVDRAFGRPASRGGRRRRLRRDLLGLLGDLHLGGALRRRGQRRACPRPDRAPRPSRRPGRRGASGSPGPSWRSSRPW